MNRLAVFDCDGTLVDSQRRIIAAVEAAWHSVGRAAPDHDAIRGIVGLALPEALSRLAPEVDRDELLQMIDGFRQTFHRISSDPAYDEPLYPGVVEAIAELEAAGVLLGVATGKGQRGLRKTLERHGLLDRFIVLKTADDGPSKPHPQILKDAMAEAGAGSETTVMIGDTAFDMAMARSAQAHALGVAWGYHSRQDLFDHGADAVLETYADTPVAVLARIGQI